MLPSGQGAKDSAQYNAQNKAALQAVQLPCCHHIPVNKCMAPQRSVAASQTNIKGCQLQCRQAPGAHHVVQACQQQCRRASSAP